MKLKYKKIIMLTAMSTMGIGILTISLGNDRSRAEESLKSIESEDSSQDDNSRMALAMGDTEESAALIAKAALDEVADEEPTPTEVPTPTPLPVYEIEEDKYPEIDAMFQDYYAAKNSSDVKKMKSILSDPSKVVSEEQLQSKTDYIDDYRNIKSYTKKGYIEGTYVVYVYHEIKFTSINTPAPGLKKFYVITDSDGKYKIYSGVIDGELKTYYAERDSDSDVQELIKMTEDKSDKAKEKDEDLASFWKGIDDIINKQKAESKESSKE